MQKIFEKIRPEWVLRFGLGLTYLYSGSDLFFNPQHWYGFVPRWFSQAVTPVLPIDIYLKIQGAGELLIAFLFLTWFLGKRAVRVASVVVSIEMGLIILFTGLDLITFRDIGILSAALALLIISSDSEKQAKDEAQTQ